MKKICIRAIVSGKVQGVFFRAHTQKKAEELQLTGWVRNLENGNVEVLACGPEEKIDAFKDWLWEGSPNSKVSNIDFNDEQIFESKKFEIKNS